jgi:hypothetical protein
MAMEDIDENPLVTPVLRAAAVSHLAMLIPLSKMTLMFQLFQPQ